MVPVVSVSRELLKNPEMIEGLMAAPQVTRESDLAHYVHIATRLNVQATLSLGNHVAATMEQRPSRAVNRDSHAFLICARLGSAS